MTAQVYNVEMFYDSYESDFGDGFYPMTTSSGPCTTKTTIGFQLLRLPSLSGHKVPTKEFSRSSAPCSELITETDSNVYWKQTNNYKIIQGLDGNEGILLFTQLNNQLSLDNNNNSTFVTVNSFAAATEFSRSPTLTLRLAPKGIVNTFGKIIYPKNT